MKRIVILADGTWMTVKNDTNVWKMRNLIPAVGSDGVQQLVRYNRGVGAGLGLDRLLGGAFGTGLSREVMDCYRILVERYEPGDELYFFGYSRGAFTVRSLGGLVNNLGILHQQHADRIVEAYEHYRDPDPSWRPHGAAAEDFTRRYCWPMPQITCIGVWDTVGSLGIPTNGPIGRWTRQLHGFHDVRLGGIVRNGFQALAVDEHRGPFRPAIWLGADAHQAAGQRLEQRWFPGSHSNVGGGFGDARLSDAALTWIAERASSCGLQILTGSLPSDDQFGGRICDSYSPFFRGLDWWNGEKDINRLIGLAPSVGEDGDTYRSYEALHPITQARLERFTGPPRYAPTNVLDYLSRTRSVTVG
jgi:uncharacterized protein (DUF2235 family)